MKIVKRFISWLRSLRVMEGYVHPVKHGPFCPWRPKDDVLAGLVWRWDGAINCWREVCDFCGGNCGQCGITRRVGNRPASLEAIVKNGGWDKGSHAGLVGSPGDRARRGG